METAFLNGMGQSFECFESLAKKNELVMRWPEIT
jgi:hypothetical protein